MMNLHSSKANHVPVHSCKSSANHRVRKLIRATARYFAVGGISHHSLHDFVFISRSDNDLSAGMQSLHAMSVQIGNNGLQGFYCRGGGGLGRHFIRLPLVVVTKSSSVASGLFSKVTPVK